MEGSSSKYDPGSLQAVFNEEKDSPEAKKLSAIAQDAAHRGYLAVGELDMKGGFADVTGSVQNFHSAASALTAVQMPYPMVHLPAVGWVPLDLRNSISAPANPLQPVTPTEIIDLAQRAPREAERVGMRFTVSPVPQARPFLETYWDGSSSHG